MLKISFSETLSNENLTAKDKGSVFDQLAGFFLAGVVAVFAVQFGTECIATGSYIKHVFGQLIIKRKSSVHTERWAQVIDCVSL